MSKKNKKPTTTPPEGGEQPRISIDGLVAYYQVRGFDRATIINALRIKPNEYMQAVYRNNMRMANAPKEHKELCDAVANYFKNNITNI